MRYLIVNADDFGLSPEINRGVIKAHESGIVTATSLVATGACFPDAVRAIEDHPSLDVGIHFTLIEERPILNGHRIPTLIDDRGCFRRNIYAFFYDYMRGNIAPEEVGLELRAQTEKILDHGIRITHADSHQHVHMFPGILEIVIRICREYGIPYLRFPRERIHGGNMFHVGRIPRFVQQLVLNSYCHISRDRFRDFAVDSFYGFYDGGELSKERLLGIVKKLREGTSELMCHPAEDVQSGRESRHSQWSYRGDIELACLTDEGIREALRERNAHLITYKDLGVI